MPSTYNATYIRIELGILDCPKFENDEQLGAYTRCVVFLAKCDDNHKGWAYLSGRPLTDRETAVRMHYKTDDEWMRVKNILIKNTALLIDKNGAWGLNDGENNWDRHQGADMRRRQYMKKYHEDHKIPINTVK